VVRLDLFSFADICFAFAFLCSLSVLFKLIQMQKVDEKVLERLIDRFFELDPDGSGSLSIGLEIPNKEQVAEMKTIIEGTGMTLQEAWSKHLSDTFRLRTEVTTNPLSNDDTTDFGQNREENLNENKVNQKKIGDLLDMKVDDKDEAPLDADFGQEVKKNLEIEFDQKRKERLDNFMSGDFASRGGSPESPLPRFILGKGSRI